MIKLLLLLGATLASAQEFSNTTYCKNQPDNVLLPVPGDCGSYYSCYKGQDWKLSCGEFYFDRRTQVCNYLEYVPDCYVDCVPATGVHNQPSPSSCREYFVCLDSQPILQDCGEGYLYDKAENACNAAELVTDCEAGPPPGFNPCQGKEDGYRAAGTACNKFFWCLNGEVLSEDVCSPGLEFSETIQQCVPADESTCVAAA